MQRFHAFIRPFCQFEGRFRRGFCSTVTINDKLVASVLFERLLVVVPKIDPLVYAFQEFSFRWNQQNRREYPEKFLQKSDARGKGDYHIDYQPAPRITEADKANDRSTFGSPGGQPVWHFPEKVYELKRLYARVQKVH